MPRHPSEYGNLLRDLIATHQVDCWLVNTGWTGGKYGVGQRMPIKVTRKLLARGARRFAGQGALSHRSLVRSFDAAIRFQKSEPSILDPVETWTSKEDFAATAKKLVKMFRENFVKFEPHVDSKIMDAQPGRVIGA